MTTKATPKAQHSKVLVFGASGFIGRWVAQRLCHQGAKPFLIVRNCAAAEQVFADYQITGELIETDLQRLDSVGELIAKIKALG